MTIAYIGRYTTHNDTTPVAQRKLSPFDLMHETVLKDQLKTLGDSLGVRISLRTFDNGRDPRISDSIYRLISQDTTIDLVVDNTWGEHLIPSASLIRQHAIPLLSINADRGSAEFGESALFLGNDDIVPENIATYLRDVLKYDRVVFLGEEDYPLHVGFIDNLAGHGIEIHKLCTLNLSDTTTIQRAIDSVVAFYVSHPKDRQIPLLLNVHNAVGDRVLAAVESRLDSITIVGGAYVASLAALQRLGRVRSGAGHRLIIMGRPTDAVSRTIALDLDRYRQEQPDVFGSPSAPFFLARCVAVAELVGALLKDSALRTMPIRSLVARKIHSFEDASVVGASDLYEFDSAGNLLTDVYFTLYQEDRRGGDFRSLPIQINRQRQQIPDLQFGLDIQNIHDIDVDNNTFKADFFYWVNVDTAFRKAEEELVFRNLIESENAPTRVMEKIDGSTLYRLYKVSGTFGHQYVLRDYPTDQQELVISLEVLSPSDRLRISFDKGSIDIDPATLERFRVSAWRKQKYYVTVDNRVSTTMRGNPELRGGKPAVFKTIAFRLMVKRKLLGPFLEIVLPLSLIGFVAIALLYVNDISFSNLGDVIVGTFLGIITFSIVLSAITPSSDYLTRADILFWTTFIVVLTSFMTVIIVNARHKAHELDGVDIKPVRLTLAVVYPLAILAVLML